MAVMSDITYKRALELKLSIWDIYLSNWGNRTTAIAGEPTAIQFPVDSQAAAVGPSDFQILYSCLGMRIGPQSTVDAVCFNYDTRQSDSGPPLAVNATNLGYLTKDQPVLYPIKGPITFYSKAPTALSRLIPGGSTTQFGREFQDVALIGAGATATFDAAFGALLAPPLLHVQMFLEASPLLYTALSSSSFRRGPMDDAKNSNVENGIEEIMGVWPIWGRRVANIGYAIFPDSTFGITVRTTGLIRGSDPNNRAFVEIPLTGAATAVPLSGAYGGITHTLTDLNAVAFVVARAAGTGGLSHATASIFAED